MKKEKFEKWKKLFLGKDRAIEQYAAIFNHHKKKEIYTNIVQLGVKRTRLSYRRKRLRVGTQAPSKRAFQRRGASSMRSSTQNP